MIGLNPALAKTGPDAMQLQHETLANQWVRLEPLREVHRVGLRTALGDGSVLRYSPSKELHAGGFDLWFDWQLTQAREGRWLPYAVLHSGRVVGESCYLNPRAYDSGVEIGGTWYEPDARGGIVNPSCKLLLLGHAFDAGAERVELKTDAENAQSRAAILKLGAQFEGIHRRHMRRPWGGWRDTAWFSVLRDEWPAVKAGLEARVAAL